MNNNIHEINISLNRNDNSILNSCNITKPNVNNKDNTNRTNKNNNNRPTTRCISKNLTKSINTIVPNDSCSNDDNHNDNSYHNNNGGNRCNINKSIVILITIK